MVSSLLPLKIAEAQRSENVIVALNILCQLLSARDQLLLYWLIFGRKLSALFRNISAIPDYYSKSAPLTLF
jgi:hypothetical protein